MILRGGTSIEHESNNDADKAVLERIRRINLAFVALGDDDENIEMSIHLRMLFDRLNEINNKQAKQMEWRKEPVEIFSIVYDERKSGIIRDEKCSAGNSCGLKIITIHRIIFTSWADCLLSLIIHAYMMQSLKTVHINSTTAGLILNRKYIMNGWNRVIAIKLQKSNGMTGDLSTN